MCPSCGGGRKTVRSKTCDKCSGKGLLVVVKELEVYKQRCPSCICPMCEGAGYQWRLVQNFTTPPKDNMRKVLGNRKTTLLKVWRIRNSARVLLATDRLLTIAVAG